MTRVGYLEGTDALFLNELVTRGYDTLPLSNGVDNHGKFVGHLTKADEVTVVVGFLFKVIPLADSGLTSMDILHSCQVHNTPTLIIAQREIHERAVKALGDAASIVTLVDPSEVSAALDKMLG
jgi:hypothetical protein